MIGVIHRGVGPIWISARRMLRMSVPWVVAMVALAAVVGNAPVAFAQANGLPPREESSEPLPLRRYRLIYAPLPLIQRNAIGEYRTMLRSEFERLVTALQQPRPLPIIQQAMISQATYTARLENEHLLSGSVSWQLTTFSQQPTWLDLGSLSLALSDFRWLQPTGELSEPTVGANRDGNVLVRVPSSGTLQARWTLAGDPTGTAPTARDRVFQLQLPQSPVNRFDLRLPADLDLYADGGLARRIVLDRDPATFQIQSSDFSHVDVWRVDFGGRQTGQLRVRRRDSPERRVGYRQQSRYTISERGVELSCDFTFDCDTATLSQLELQVAPELRITQVQQNGRELAWLANRQPESMHAATIPLAPALTGLNRVVRVLATAPPPPTAAIWTLPSILATNVDWQQESATLRLMPPIRLNDFQLSRAIQVPATDVSLAASTYYEIRYQGPNHSVHLRLEETPTVTTSTSATQVATDANGMTATVRLAIRSAADVQFVSSLRLIDGWNIESVEDSTADGLDDWRVVPSPTAPRRLELRFREPIPAGQPVRVTVRARRAFGDHDRSLKLGQIRPLLPTDDRPPTRHFLSFLTDDQTRVRFPGADRMTWLKLDDLDAVEASLLNGNQAGPLILLDESSVNEIVVFEERPNESPQLQAAIECRMHFESPTLAEQAGADVDERLVVEVTRQGAVPPFVEIECSAERAAPFRWSLQSAPHRELDATRVAPEPGTSDGGETWRLAWPDVNAERLTFVGERHWSTPDEATLTLARVPHAAQQTGMVVLEYPLNVRPEIRASRLLTAAPREFQPLRRIGKLQQVYRYAPLATLRTEDNQVRVRFAPPEIGPDRSSPVRPPTTAHAKPLPITVWHQTLETYVDPIGTARDELSLWLENHGADNLELRLPASCQLRQVRVASETLTHERLDGNWIRIPLPSSDRFPKLILRFDRKLNQLSAWQTVDVVRPEIRAQAIVHQSWIAWVPNNFGIADLTRRPHERGQGSGHTTVAAFTFGISDVVARRWLSRSNSTADSSAAQPRLGDSDATRDRFPAQPGVWSYSVTRPSARAGELENDVSGDTEAGEVGAPISLASDASPIERAPVAMTDVELDSDFGSSTGLPALTGWRRHELKNAKRMFVYHEPAFQVIGYSIFLAAISLTWLRSRANWRRGVMISTVFAVVGLLTYTPFQSLAVLGFWGSLIGIALPRLLHAKQLARVARYRQRRDSNIDSRSAVTLTARQATQRATLVCMALSIYACGAADARAQTTDNPVRGLTVDVDQPIAETDRDADLAETDVDANRSATVEPNPARNGRPSDAAAASGLRLDDANYLPPNRIGSETRLGDAGAGATNVTDVFVPIDSEGRPEGKYLFLPMGFQQLLSTTSSFNPGHSPVWILTSARYRGAFERMSDQAQLELATLTADFELDVTALDVVIQFPLAAEAAGVLQREAFLNGRPLQLRWDATRGAIMLPIRQTGKHHLQLTFRAITVVEGGLATVRLPVPPAAQATLSLASPQGLSDLRVVSAFGSTIRREATGQLTAELGPARMVQIEWPVAASKDPKPVVEQLGWLRLSRDEVRLDVLLVIDARRFQRSTLIAHVDERLQADYQQGDQPLSFGPAAENGMRQIELDATNVDGDHKRIKLSFVVKGMSGVGFVPLPRVHLVGQTVTSSLAVSADPRLVLRVEPGNGQPLKVNEFVARWGGTQAPDFAYQFEQEVHGWVCQGQWSLPPAQVNLELAFALGKTQTRVVAIASFPNDQATTFQQRLNVPSNLEIESIQLLPPSTNESLRWSRHMEDQVTVFYDPPRIGPYRLGIAAVQNELTVGKRRLPKPRFLDTVIDQLQVDILRQPNALLPTAAEDSQIAPELPVYTRNLLGPTRWSRRWDAPDWSQSWDVEVIANERQLEARLIDVVARENGRWFHDVEIQLETKSGVLDQLTLELPDTWRAGLQSDGYRMTFAQSLKPDMMRVTLWPQAGAFKAVDFMPIRREFPSVREGALSVPHIRLLESADVDRRIYLPIELDGQQIPWSYTGLQPIDESEPPPLLPPGTYRGFRVVDESFQATKLPTRNAAGKPRVALADIHLVWHEEGGYHGLVLLDLLPDGADQCQLRFPLGCRPIWVTVEQQPVVARGRKTTDITTPITTPDLQHLIVPLASDQLPQRIAVAFEGQGEIDIATLGAPSLTLLDQASDKVPVERTLWTIHNAGTPGQLSAIPHSSVAESNGLPAPRQRTSSVDQLPRTTIAESEQIRLEQLGVVFQHAADVAPDYPAEDLRRWYQSWGYRFITRLATTDRGQENGAGAGSPVGLIADVEQPPTDTASDATSEPSDGARRTTSLEQLPVSQAHLNLVRQYELEKEYQRLISARVEFADASTVWREALPDDAETIVLALDNGAESVDVRRSRPLSARWGKALMAAIVVLFNYRLIMLGRS